MQAVREVIGYLAWGLMVSFALQIVAPPLLGMVGWIYDWHWWAAMVLISFAGPVKDLIKGDT